MQLNENNFNETKLKYLLVNSLKIIRIYDWIIDAYVLDFYTDNHWNKLPNSWKNVFYRIDPIQLSEFLQDYYQQTNTKTSLQSNYVWPLSLLALKILIKNLCILRRRNEKNFLNSHISKTDNSNDKNIKLSDDNETEANMIINPKTKSLFTKCVKWKKRHEIENMGKACYHIAKKLNVQYIVDFGSGLGHLARTLSYGYGLNVCCLEMESNLNEQAEIIDSQFEITASKYVGNTMQDDNNFTKKHLKRPKHITIKLTKQTTSNEFLFVIKSAFNIISNVQHNDNDNRIIDDNDNCNANNSNKLCNNNDEQFRFGIIGLHPCGDLGAILIDLFLKCDEAKFLNLVGCCYMKLTTEHVDDHHGNVDNGNQDHSGTNKNVNNNNSCINSNGNKFGYPLSKFLNSNFNDNYQHLSKLSYESREIACHAIEMYTERLRNGYYDDLKVHSYRAALEHIIIKYYPEYKHCGLKNVKHTKLLTFKSYCEKALSGLNIDIPLNEILSSDTNYMLGQWKNVVIFYTLRLIFAPLIESIILYDRILYLQENGCNVSINAIFDPLISPRNHITIATKQIS